MQYNKVTHVLFDLDGLLIDILAGAPCSQSDQPIECNIKVRSQKLVKELNVTREGYPEQSKGATSVTSGGVLLEILVYYEDSERIYTEVFTNVCAQYGKQFTWELKKSILGFQGHEYSEKIIKALCLPITAEKFLEECRKQSEKLLVDVPLMPGAKKLIEHLHSQGVPIALATSSGKDSVDIKMKNQKELLQKFHHLTMGTTDPEVTKGKPDPAIFLVCASKFPDKPKPEDCLVFEDAVNGMKAACAANMQVVVVPDPRIEPELLTDATLVFQSLEDFQPEIFGLPPYE